MGQNLDEYFMGIALLCEKRSKDISRQVGACIVSKDETIIATGYNGMPLNCLDSTMLWGKQSPEDKEKHKHVCHAELNAIVNMDPKSVEGCTLYVTLFPCNGCAKVIVRSGIKKVVYLSDDKSHREEFQAARKILDAKEETNPIEVQEFEKTMRMKVLELYKTMQEEDSESQDSDRRKKAAKQIISWDHYFMALAKLTAEMRSMDSSKQGACLVNGDKRIVGLGHVYNMLKNDDGELGVCHAPETAIVNKTPTSLRGCTLYVTHFPCKDCAKIIVQSGIRKVVYLEKIERKIEEDPATKTFAIAHIKMKSFSKKSTSDQKIELDYAPVVPSKQAKKN